MAAGKTIETNSKNRDAPIGLLANGSSGPWEISVDETISGVERWFAQIEGPSIYLYFELPSLDLIPKTARFLTPLAERAKASSSSSRTNGELLVSEVSEIPVSLVRDDEFEDRCFVVVGQIDRPIMRCSLTGEDSRNLVEALRQVEKDLPRHTPSAKKRKEHQAP